MPIAALRGIDWYEDGRLEEHRPDPNEPFRFEVNLSIGLHGAQAADLFRVRVCNALAIADDAKHDRLLFGYGKVVVYEFDFAMFEGRIARWCATCRAETWDEIARMVSRIGTWALTEHRLERKAVAKLRKSRNDPTPQSCAQQRVSYHLR